MALLPTIATVRSGKSSDFKTAFRAMIALMNFGLVFEVGVRVAVAQLFGCERFELRLVLCKYRLAQRFDRLFDRLLIVGSGHCRHDQGCSAEREHARSGQITTCQVHGYPPIVIVLLIRAARPSHPSARRRLVAGDDQHSKIWRGGGAQFGGYRFGRSERRFPDLGPGGERVGWPVDRGRLISSPATNGGSGRVWGGPVDIGSYHLAQIPPRRSPHSVVGQLTP